jgi:2,4-dienoyl-CoA reductase-like NADH-dependent reductase (Old Yellow Enzyme family)
MSGQREKILALFDRFEHPLFPAKNRFVRSATWLAGAEEQNGRMTMAEVNRHAEIAAGGAGTLITGAAYINSEAKGLKRQWGMDSDEKTADVAMLAEAIHKFGSRLIVQLCHAGGQRDASVASGTRSLSPSGGTLPLYKLKTEAISSDDILKIRSDFAKAALRVKSGGADGVQIHGGHGFLLTQFLSPLLNKRNDLYGGTLENRSRIFFEILKDVRDAVGKNFPVWFKISIAEGIEKGYTPEDGLWVAENLMNEGADAIEVSSGSIYAGPVNAPSVIGIGGTETEAPFRNYAAELKKFASAEHIIILTGGIRSLQVMSDLIHDNECDLLGISRPFIAEPDLVNRWYEEDSRPSACISCNACLNSVKSGIIDCPVLRDRNEGYWDAL